MWALPGGAMLPGVIEDGMGAHQSVSRASADRPTGVSECWWDSYTGVERCFDGLLTKALI